MKPAVGYTHRPASNDERDVEAWGLIEAARRIILAAQKPENPDELRGALMVNQRLWTIFQASALEDDCPLPPGLRQNILQLSIIVDQDTYARLSDLDVTKLDRLIDINRQLAAGLSERPGAQTAAQAAPQAGGPGDAAAPQSPAPAPQPAAMPRGYGSRGAAPAPTAPPPGDGKISISI